MSVIFVKYPIVFDEFRVKSEGAGAQPELKNFFSPPKTGRKDACASPLGFVTWGAQYPFFIPHTP